MRHYWVWLKTWGRALVIGFNKWDGMSEDQKTSMQRKIDLKLTFLDYATQATYFSIAWHRRWRSI